MKRNWIAGNWVEGDRPSPNINPSDTTDVVGDYAQAGEAHARDAVAAALGVDDGPRGPVTWRYAQRRAKTYAVEVRVEVCEEE